MTKSLGTILPTPASLAAGDRAFEAQERRNAGIGARAFPGIVPRREQGEYRYYTACNRFAVVGSSGRVLWFEIRPDGVYSVKPSPEISVV